MDYVKVTVFPWAWKRPYDRGLSILERVSHCRTMGRRGAGTERQELRAEGRTLLDAADARPPEEGAQTPGSED